MAVSPYNVVKILESIVKKKGYKEKLITANDSNMANQLFDIIVKSSEAYSSEIYDDEDTLDFLDPYDSEANPLNFDNNDINAEVEYEGENSDDMEVDIKEGSKDDYDLAGSQEPPNQRARQLKVHDVTLDYKIRCVTYALEHPNFTFKSIKPQFKKLASERMLYSWKKTVSRQGSKLDHFKEINQFVYDSFIEARQKAFIVRDQTLRVWAYRKSKELGVVHKASIGWLHSFKTHYRIVSRKITKFVTLSFASEDELALERIDEFRSTMTRKISRFNGKVWNADQSGIQKEMHMGRTLEEKGKKQVKSAIKSKSFMTHSNTIMPVISSDGDTLPILYICCQESNKPSTSVLNNMLMAPNIYYDWSSSGKMHQDNFVVFLKKNVIPQIEQYGSNVLVLDDYHAHKNPTLLQKAMTQSGTSCKIVIENIPPGLTSNVQPEDVYLSHPMKSMNRRFEDYVLLNEFNIQLSNRDYFIKRWSLIWNQFCSPKFRNAIRYAWYKAGLIDVPPFQHEGVNSFCFPNTLAQCELNCDQPSFIRCAWCFKSICFEHFFIDYHYCDVYEGL